MVRAWNIRFKDGKPVINIVPEGIQPIKTLKVESKDVKITPEGLQIGDTICSFDKVHYNTVPSPIKQLGVDLSHPHILHLVYEIIAGYLNSKNPVVVEKTPYDIAKIIAKYPEFGINAEVFSYFEG